MMTGSGTAAVTRAIPLVEREFAPADGSACETVRLPHDATTNDTIRALRNAPRSSGKAHRLASNTPCPAVSAGSNRAITLMLGLASDDIRATAAVKVR